MDMNTRVYNALRKVASMNKEADWLDEVSKPLNTLTRKAEDGILTIGRGAAQLYNDGKHIVQGFRPQHLIPSSTATVPQPTTPTPTNRLGRLQQQMLSAAKDPRIRMNGMLLQKNRPEWVNSALSHLSKLPAATATKVPGTGAENMGYFERGTRSLKNLRNNITGNNHIVADAPYQKAN